MRGSPGIDTRAVFLNMFMNDLVYLMKNCNISTYADNTQIFAAETEPDKLQEMTNTDLAAIERWYDTNGMEPLKISSNGYGQLTNSETKVPLRHCDTAIIQQYQLVKTSLSLVSLLTTSWTSINRSLMWQERYPNSLQYWKRLRNILPRYKENNLIISYCLPPPPRHFDNFSDVWYFCIKTASDKLEKVNEGALHFVLKDKSSPYTELLLLRRSTTYNLRGTDFLTSTKVNSTKHGLRSWRYLAPKIWNALPETLKQEST